MKRQDLLSLDRLIEGLEVIEDPRRPWGNIQHKLVDILVILLFAIICGCNKWEEIEDYGHTKREWLEGIIELPHGIPSADTFRRLLQSLKPAQLEEAYRQWVTPYVGSCLHKQISVDGKTVRGASVGKDAGERLHMVSAWVREDGISLGQIRTDEKSNEITAIPQLLESLDIQGGIVTIDAMGCQRNITQTIVSRGANYLLAVKKNQPTLYREIDEYFTWASDDKIEANNLSRHETIQKEHGRITTWKVTATKEVSWFESHRDWTSLNAFVMVEKTTLQNEETSRDTRYYISSLPQDAATFHRLIRGHWSIENQLHWVLDVTFQEDKTLIRKDHSPENLSLLRKVALALLKKDTSRNASVRRKQNIAGWDDAFLASLF